MIPEWFFPVSSISSAIASVYTAKKSRELTLKMEERRIQEKKLADAEAHQRALKLQSNAQDNAIKLKELEFELDLIRNQLKTQYEQNQIWARRGNWLDTVAPHAKPPIVIFDNTIRNNSSVKDNVFAFNPMESLSYAFKRQIKFFSPPYDIYVTSLSQEFRNQAAVEAFYNDELADLPAVIVYGNFDGNYLRINAVYGGMLLEQHIFDQEFKPIVLGKRPKDVCLSEIPLSVIQKITDTAGSRTETQILHEKIQKNLIDLVSNISLQGLIDSHFSIYDSSYTPIAGAKSVLDQSGELGILTEELKGAVSEHRKNMLEQRDRIRIIRAEYLKDFMNNNPF